MAAQAKRCSEYITEVNEAVRLSVKDYSNPSWEAVLCRLGRSNIELVATDARLTKLHLNIKVERHWGAERGGVVKKMVPF